MPHHERSLASLDRRNGRKKPRKSILIVCEGSETEPNYFKFLRGKDGFNIATTVEIKIEIADSSPNRVISRAIQLRDERKRDAKKSLVVSAYDEIWCVFDREAENEGSTFISAIDKANQEKVDTAFSNPSFEFWLLLHFRFTTRLFRNSDEVENELRKEIESELKQKYDKHIDEKLFKVLFARIKAAIANGEKIQEFHKNENVNQNPFTNVHLLVNQLCKTAQFDI